MIQYEVQLNQGNEALQTGKTITANEILLPLHLARRTSPRMALAKVATRAAVRLAGSWRLIHH